MPPYQSRPASGGRAWGFKRRLTPEVELAMPALFDSRRQAAMAETLAVFAFTLTGKTPADFINDATKKAQRRQAKKVRGTATAT